MNYFPLITIVIASYNSGKTMRRALQSVKEQEFQDWECLIIDGCSKDNTISIVQEFVDKDSRFRFISEPDKGIYDAYNKGWQNAKGQWIYYLGSDDWLTKAGMSELASHKETNAAILASYIYLYHTDGEIYKSKAFDGKLAYHQGMIMRRSVIEALNGFDLAYEILADSDLVVKCLTSGYKEKDVEAEPIAYFTQGGTSSQLSTAIKVIKEKYIIYRKYNYVDHPMMDVGKYAFFKIRSLVYRKIRSIIKK